MATNRAGFVDNEPALKEGSHASKPGRLRPYYSVETLLHEIQWKDLSSFLKEQKKKQTNNNNERRITVAI